MRRIIITGAGGAPATNFTRSLRLASSRNFHLIGVDSDKFYLQRAETDERFLVPYCDEPDYLPILNQIIEETGAEFLFSQPDKELFFLSENRDCLACRTFLPARETIRICADKFHSYERWIKAGLKVPKTILISTPEDLKIAMAAFGPRIWLRSTRGAFGKGALPTDNLDTARSWIDFHRGWGLFTAAACLREQSVTWQSIWKDGELVVAQGRKRLYWEFANRAPSGVTGLTGTGVTISDPDLDRLAEAAIKAIDPWPTGIFSVDFTHDHEGVPNPTEINCGRFFTTHLFFSSAGLNMPCIYVELAFGGRRPRVSKKYNPLPSDLAWVRGMDVEPVLTDVQSIERSEEELSRRRRSL